MEITQSDLDSLAAKLNGLELSHAESTALTALLAGEVDASDEVSGFALQRMQQNFTGSVLADALTATNLFSTSASGPATDRTNKDGANFGTWTTAGMT